jgi:hypothetical protein
MNRGTVKSRLRLRVQPTRMLPPFSPKLLTTAKTNKNETATGVFELSDYLNAGLAGAVQLTLK